MTEFRLRLSETYSDYRGISPIPPPPPPSLFSDAIGKCIAAALGSSQATDLAVRAALAAQAKADQNPGNINLASAATAKWNLVSNAIEQELFAKAKAGTPTPDLPGLTQQILARYAANPHLTAAANGAQVPAEDELNVNAALTNAEAAQAQYQLFIEKNPFSLLFRTPQQQQLERNENQQWANVQAAVQADLNDTGQTPQAINTQVQNLKGLTYFDSKFTQIVQNAAQSKNDELGTERALKSIYNIQTQLNSGAANGVYDKSLVSLANSQAQTLSDSAQAEMIDAANGAMNPADAIDAINRQAGAILARDPGSAGLKTAVDSARTRALDQWNAMQISPQYAQQGRPFTAADLYDNSSTTQQSGDLSMTPGLPNAADVDQSGIGDCYFDATLAGLAKQDPQFIKNAISYSSDTGDFTVTLYKQGWNGAIQPVEVTITQSDIAQDLAHHGSDAYASGSATDSNPRIWSAVMEAAYAKMRDGGGPEPTAGSSASADDAEYKNIVGGWGREAFLALTGQSGTELDTSLPSFMPRSVGFPTAREMLNSDYQQISQALANHQAVDLATNGGLPATSPLVGDHEYEVVSIYKNSSGDIMMNLRNPWGTNALSATNVKNKTQNNQIVTVNLSGAMVSGQIDELDIGPSVDNMPNTFV